ncbi:MAG TPA: hypothetical protein VMY43_11300 [Methanothrix sp.]|nr:hypothetical protein [Methanothrix sp.]
MRGQIVLISILILWASVAHGAISGQATGLDILGSLANNTTIIAPEGMPIEVDIIGSTASNIQIGYPIEVINKACGSECWGCGPCGEVKCYRTPWDDFKRPLCYPWSSYIPTRYSRSLIKTDPVYVSTAPKILTLGWGATYP